MKELAIKLYVTGKINEFIRKRVLEEEIVNKTAKGVDKLNNVLDKHVWGNIEKFVNAARKKDNKIIPNFLETFSEDVFENVFKEVRKDLDLRELLEDILKEEKQDIKI